MTGAEIQATYFSPQMYILYLFVIFALMIAYYQWQWHRRVERDVRLLVRESDGSTSTYYVPKTNTSVSITNPQTGLTRTWPFSEICTIEMMYPGDGFIPSFLQRKIRTLIMDANDWEPLLNRGAYNVDVASPDVKDRIKSFAGAVSDEKIRTQLMSWADGLRTAPTREMIASPAVLGNIAKEKVSELAVTVAKDIMNPLQDAIKKLGRQMSPTIVYIGLGLIAILLVYVVFQLRNISEMDLSKVADLVNDIAQIKTALGVK